MSNKRLLRRRDVLAGGAAGLGLLAGCGGTSNPFETTTGGNGGNGDNGDNGSDGSDGSDGDGNTGGTAIKIGVLSPQSGRLSRFGTEIDNVVNIVKRQVDEADNDYTVDLSIKDTESSPDTAVGKAQELIDEGYRAMVGPGANESASRVAQEVLVPESAIAMSPLANITPKNDDGLMYIVGPTAADIGNTMPRPLSLDQAESASIIRDGTDYSNAIMERLTSQFETRGIEVPAEETVDPGASSYAGAIEAAVADDPAGLIVLTGPGAGQAILEEFYADFGGIPVFLPDRLRFPDLPSQVGSDMAKATVVGLRPLWEYDPGQERLPTPGEAEGTKTLTATPTEFPSPVHAPLQVAYRNEYDRLPVVQSAQAFDATVPLLLATVSASEYTGPAIRDSVQQVTASDLPPGQAETFDSRNYWTGLGRIDQGLGNVYVGPSGGNINAETFFDPNSKALTGFSFAASSFVPDAEFGFETRLPLPLSN